MFNHFTIFMLCIIRCFFVKSCYGKPEGDSLLYRPNEYDMYDSSKCANFSAESLQNELNEEFHSFFAVCHLYCIYFF